MGEIVIKCPETGADVKTGIVTYKADASANFKRNMIHCPQCNKSHAWDRMPDEKGEGREPFAKQIGGGAF